jgi:hypothetical protein
MVDQNPTMYPMGTAIQARDGSAWIVSANDGITVTIKPLNGDGSGFWEADGTAIKNTNAGDVEVQNNFRSRGFWDETSSAVTDPQVTIIDGRMILGNTLAQGGGAYAVILANNENSIQIGNSNSGANVNYFGGDHPTDPQAVLFRAGEEWTLSYKHDIEAWDFQDKNAFVGGNVGIGSITPIAKLTVDGGGVVIDPLATDGDKGVGTINVSGNYYVNGVPISGFVDAPSDGEIYGRLNAAWAIVTGGGTISNLASVPTNVQVTITNTGGDNAIVLGATNILSGVMTAAQVTKLEGIATGATKSDLSIVQGAINTTINNSGGTGVVILAATQAESGVMTAADKTKLDETEKSSTGAWTPTLVFYDSGTVVGSNVYNGQVGKWTRIGQIVILEFEMTVRSNYSDPNDAIAIGGIPFTFSETYQTGAVGAFLNALQPSDGQASFSGRQNQTWMGIGYWFDRASSPIFNLASYEQIANNDVTIAGTIMYTTDDA